MRYKICHCLDKNRNIQNNTNVTAQRDTHKMPLKGGLLGKREWE